MTAGAVRYTAMAYLGEGTGEGVRLAEGGDPSRSRLAHQGKLIGEGLRPVYGPAAPMEFCAAVKDDGSQCGGRPAKGTEFCAGHLRSQERL